MRTSTYLKYGEICDIYDIKGFHWRDFFYLFSIYHYLASHRHRLKGNQMNTKLIVRAIFFLAMWIVMVFTHPLAYACTAFMMSDDESVLVGNNEDYKIPYTRVWFVPAENDRYGRVFFGYDNWSPQGGMNDQGLFFDFFATKKLEIKLSKGKPKFPGPMLNIMLAELATVEEVLEMFGQYNLEWMSKGQMFIVDKSGDAAIIEGDEVIRKSGSYQVVTNFRLSKIPEDQRPCRWPAWSCSRYKKAEKMLAQSNTVTVSHFRDILKATHRSQYNVIARTLYSNIYDLKKGLVYLYYLHNFDNEVVLDLNEELKKGRHYYELPSLFGKELTYDRKVYTHPSPAFSISYPKHYKVTEPAQDEVLRAKYPISSLPLFQVVVKDKPQDIRLQDIGERHYTNEFEKFGSSVKLVSSMQTALSDGTPANEVQFDWVSNDHWPVKTMIVSTYREDKLIFAAVSSTAHPEALREFLYSLRFD